MRSSALSLLLPMFLLLSALPAHAEGPWKTVSNKNGVLLEKRDVPGSPMPEVRATAHSALPVSRVAAATWADRSGSKFVSKSRRKHVLLRDTGLDRIVYEQVSTPVVSDRDYTVHLHRDSDGASGPYHSTFKLDNDAGPPPAPGVVRMTVLRGSWNITPAADGGCDVVYIVHSEVGGSIPAFIVRGALVDSGRDLMVDVLEWASSHP